MKSRQNAKLVIVFTGALFALMLTLSGCGKPGEQSVGVSCGSGATGVTTVHSNARHPKETKEDLCG
jgi:hypothetical protein